LNDAFDVAIAGGGTAGCVLAARLSEDPRRRVLLVEAGPDLDAENRRDLTEVYGGRAFAEQGYYWPGLTARHVAGVGEVPFRQGHLLGGGSSINGQIALRGLPADYETWRQMGAAGWGWADVLPYFVKLETDLDFSGPAHGASGPIRIKRAPEAEGDAVTRAYMRVWSAMGYARIDDLNGEFGDGYGPLPFSNDGEIRHSASRAYLTAAVRARPNLEIRDRARALRVAFENGRATGIETLRDGVRGTVRAASVVLAAGAIRSPQLLMLSGIGDATALKSRDVEVRAHRPGVGANLQDHPIVSIAGYVEPSARERRPRRAVSTYLRYSSGVPGCEASDMVLSGGARTMWHAVGERICALRAYVAIPHSRGTVALKTADPLADPAIDFKGLSDPRDLVRLRDGYRRVAAILAERLRPDVLSDVFPARLSRRIESLSRPTAANAALARIGAALMDASPALRRLLIGKIVTDGGNLADILRDDDALDGHLRIAVGTSWHPCGTCRMGAADDPGAVVDPSGAVIGVRGLHVADASIMPRITRTNTNLPTLMIAEKIAAVLALKDLGSTPR
jgi:5-(hydroxymethyl)furfural/furfural oxidase